jgi:hypothetical protein
MDEQGSCLRLNHPGHGESVPFPENAARNLLNKSSAISAAQRPRDGFSEPTAGSICAASCPPEGGRLRPGRTFT